MSEQQRASGSLQAEVYLAITRATVVTMDDAFTVLRDATILVHEGVVVGVLDSTGAEARSDHGAPTPQRRDPPDAQSLPDAQRPARPQVQHRR